MSIGYNPSIVTDSLIVCLDAQNTKSYPGSGTTWTDISGNSNNGTLTNGPTFTSGEGAAGLLSFNFDGANDYVGNLGTATDLGINDISSSFSFLVWFKTSTTLEKYMFDNWDGSLQDISFRLDAGKLEVFIRGTAGEIPATRFGAYNLNEWNHAAYTFDGSTGTVTAYVNAVNTGSASNSNISGNFESGSSFTIGKRPGGGGQFSGDISCAMLYNKSLTEAEVKQNYNAHKGRFGL